MKSQRKAAKITTEELSAIIYKEEGGLDDLIHVGKLAKDLAKVEFSFENFDYQKNNSDPAGFCGIQTLGDLTYCGCTSGGDWEYPVSFVVYWDGKQLRGYIPKEGNTWNYKTGKAFGNDEKADVKFLKKYFNKDTFEEDYEPDDGSILLDHNKMLKAIQERIIIENEHPAEPSDELREQLAELEHVQWATWTKYFIENLTPINIERWQRQIETPYKELTEKEKDSDREWADKIIKLLEKE